MDKQIPMSRVSALFMAAFGALGVFASFMLLQSELKLLKDPFSELGCDLNPLISCSTSLLSSKSAIFGTPNSVIGLLVFSVFTTIAVLLAAGTRLPKWVWWGQLIGSATGAIYVVYFVYLSISYFGTLCPYCMLAWVSFLGIAVLVWCEAAAEGVFGSKAAASGKPLRRWWWLILLGMLLLILLAVVIGLRSSIALLF